MVEFEIAKEPRWEEGTCPNCEIFIKIGRFPGYIASRNASLVKNGNISCGNCGFELRIKKEE